MADYSGRRKFFLHMFTLIGSIACMILYLFKGEPQLWLATTMFILATVGFSGSLVFYDSFLPLIVTEDRYNSVSAKGFTYGYIGSVILLIAILLMGNKPEWFGFADSQGAYRLGFLMVGSGGLVLHNTPSNFYQRTKERPSQKKLFPMDSTN
ncbi:MAG: MFS transporter [Saprospiraceae bacterium]|nr:MFS transporter [Saprospiraceae bacterium]